MKRIGRKALLTGLLWIGFAGPAVAHPHAWIDASASLQFSDGLLTAIDVSWLLDPALSQVIIEGADTDQDGALDESESTAFATRAFKGIAEYNYFSHFRVDGQEVLIGGVTNFIPSITTDRQLEYRFRIPLPEPVDPRSHAIELALYDETYFVSVSYDVSDITLAGAGSADCSASLVPDDKHPIYFGLVVPSMAELHCSGEPQRQEFSRNGENPHDDLTPTPMDAPPAAEAPSRGRSVVVAATSVLVLFGGIVALALLLPKGRIRRIAGRRRQELRPGHVSPEGSSTETGKATIPGSLPEDDEPR